MDRGDRFERGDRGERGERGDRGERGERGERGGRSPRTRRPQKACAGEITFNYKQPETLRPYITSHGRIKPQRLNSMCTKHQRILAREIKRARHLGLLPFVTD